MGIWLGIWLILFGALLKLFAGPIAAARPERAKQIHLVGGVLIACGGLALAAGALLG